MADGSKQVTVSCSRHHDTLCRRLWHFFQTQKGTDFNLGMSSGGNSVVAHLLVVDAFLSPDKFAPELDDSKIMDRKRREAHLDSLVEFMYTGTVTVNETNLPELREIAKELEFEMLVDAVETAARRCTGRRRTTRRSTAVKAPEIENFAQSRVDTSCEDAGLTVPPEESVVETESLPDPPPAKRSRSSRTRAGTASVVAGETSIMVTEASASTFEPMSAAVASDQVDAFVELSEAEEDGSESESESLAEEDSEQESGAAGKRSTRRGATNHSAPKQCKLCRFKSISKRAYLVHQAKHDLSIRVVKCDGCRVKFVEDDKALQTHHCVERIQYNCPYAPACNYHSPSRAFYFVHLANKHNSRDAAESVFLCEVCRKPFLDARARRRHQDKQHAAGPITYRCEQEDCHYETSKLVTFKSHMFATHELDMYGAKLQKTQHCEKCDYTCVRPSDLRMHMTMKHSTVKPFKCTKCNYAAGRRQDIMTHDKRVHLQIKNHICDYCGQRSITKYGLEMHRRIHTKERPFVCEICGKAYATGATLRWHAECHIKNGHTHVCHLCGHKSSRIQYMNAHLKNVHKINVVKPRAKTASQTPVPSSE